MNMSKVDIERVLTQGNPDGLTQEQIKQAIDDTVKGFTTIADLNNFLTKLHPSDAYTLIRDVVQPKSNFMIRNQKDEELEEYQKFQEIQKQAKATFDYERKTATMFEVQQVAAGIAQKYYNIAVRMISLLDDELGRVESAVNTIEEKVGLPISKFEVKESDSNDTAEHNDEQGSEKTS